MVSHQLMSINKCSRRLFFWRVMISIHLFPSQILLCGTCHVYCFCLLSYGQNEMNYVVNQRGFPLIVGQTDLSRVRESRVRWGDGKNSWTRQKWGRQRKEIKMSTGEWFGSCGNQSQITQTCEQTREELKFMKVDYEFALCCARTRTHARTYANML